MTRIYKLDPMPLIGTTAAGQQLHLGGISSLQFIKSDGNLIHFQAMTDRGPNADEVSEGRPFLLPQYAPQLLHFTIDKVSAAFQLVSNDHFFDGNSAAFLGLPPGRESGHEENETAVDIFGLKLPAEKLGLDPEGFCLFQNTYLVAEEYGPSLLQFDLNRKLIQRWTAGHGLPNDLVKRKKNRGFEALASDGRYAYLMMQSPLSSGNSFDKSHVRLLKFDPLRSITTKQFFYPLTPPNADKIGDLVWIKNNEFYVIEQNAKLGKNGVRNIYHVDLDQADAAGVLKKKFVLDLNAQSLEFMEKIEGICMIDEVTLAVVMDNDYGLQGMINFNTGLAAVTADPVTYLAMIDLRQS